MSLFQFHIWEVTNITVVCICHFQAFQFNLYSVNKYHIDDLCKFLLDGCFDATAYRIWPTVSHAAIPTFYRNHFYAASVVSDSRPQYFQMAVYCLMWDMNSKKSAPANHLFTYHFLSLLPTSTVVSILASSTCRISLTALPNFSFRTRSMPIFMVVVELGQLPQAPVIVQRNKC